MKKSLAVILLLILTYSGARAQVFILNDDMFSGHLSRVKATVLDSLTNEPVPFASVYIIPAKDTTITNFTLTDTAGVAQLKDVPYGNYSFHVEMLGYKPFVRTRNFREWMVEMGTVKLQVDKQYLKAAVVSDVGNPIVIKQDTVEFNASSYRVGTNAMLKDLLQRMPGMEVTESGSVKFNGESIDKLTVGGRTFFFKDQSTALNNLPAKVVDKIRVIDRESEKTRATGLQDGDREKVLDVGLKKEYEKGWFGNLGLKGGTTIGDKGNETPLRDDRGLLYSGNALVSAYNEKDQITVIANGQNVSDNNAIFLVTDGSVSATGGGLGLSSAAQLAVNANTTRIKDVETTVGGNYKYADTDTGTRTERTTYQDGGNLSTSSASTGKRYANTLNANAEFKKETGKVWFHARPSFTYGRSDSTNGSTSGTSREGAFVNSSESTTHAVSDSRTADLDADVTIKDLWGKKRRSLQLNAVASYGTSNGTSDELSALTTASGTDSRAMRYDSNGYNASAEGWLRYTEPIGEKVVVSALAELSWSEGESTRDAFDAAGRNDYYSSVSRTTSVTQQYDLTAQYTFNKGCWVTLGGRALGMLKETYSKSYGIEAVTGKDEWIWTVRPNVSLQYRSGDNRLSASIFGHSQQPSSTDMLPVLDIGNPSQLRMGNVYLKPTTMTRGRLSWFNNNRKKFSSVSVALSASLTDRPVSYARWYDVNGILYSIPVNAVKPSLSAMMFASGSFHLDEARKWSILLYGSASYSSSASYQARGTLPGLDKDSFDYSEFMADFWGTSGGDRFYGGQSGFWESITTSFTPSASLTLKYNRENYWFRAGASASGHIARYSLSPDTNMNTLDTRIFVNGSYTTKHEFEFNTDLTYVFYRGYAEGYGQPEWQWNAEISKDIGAFNLNISVYDILNQTRNLTHTVTANYEEDSYRLIMGRHILFGVKWNFGKMNAAQSRRAMNASWGVATIGM